MHMTQSERLLTALKNGSELTAKQITSRFGAGNPREVVRKLREEGFPIYLNERRTTSGTMIRKYRLGRASKKMVSSYYKKHGA